MPAERVERDWPQPYERSDQVMEVFRRIYEDTEKHWDAYEMCEKLVDVEERFQLWRFRHMMTVQRIIGFKQRHRRQLGRRLPEQGAGPRFFPELWDVRTELSPPAVRRGS